MNTNENTKPPQSSGSALNDGLERNAFDLADTAIEMAYPNFYNKEKGFWGDQRIPNFGILRGAIAKAILLDRERSNAK